MSGRYSLFDPADFGLPESVSCPFCAKDETELHSPFGSALSVVTYWCRSCRTAFEWFRASPARDAPRGDRV